MLGSPVCLRIPCYSSCRSVFVSSNHWEEAGQQPALPGAVSVPAVPGAQMMPSRRDPRYRGSDAKHLSGLANLGCTELWPTVWDPPGRARSFATRRMTRNQSGGAQPPSEPRSMQVPGEPGWKAGNERQGNSARAGMHDIKCTIIVEALFKASKSSPKQKGWKG